MDGLLPTLFLLGELSREDPGDSFGFLFREVGGGPGTIWSSVGDSSGHCSTPALGREGTRCEKSSALCLVSGRGKPQGCAEGDKLDTQKKPPQWERGQSESCNGAPVCDL